MQGLPTQSRDCQSHDGDLEELGPDRDTSLAETVGKKTTAHREQDERNREQSSHHQDQPITVSLVHGHSENDEDHQVLETVFVEGALKLRDNQGPESTAPRRAKLWRAVFCRSTIGGLQYGCRISALAHRGLCRRLSTRILHIFPRSRSRFQSWRGNAGYF